MIDKQAYLLRISQAGPVGLVVINFELILDFLAAALEADDGDAFRAHLQKAKEGLNQLIQSLDFGVAMAHDFYDIYNYCHRRLCGAHFNQEKPAREAVIKEVAELMQMLLEGWRETAEKTPDDAPADAETPKVYSGLTYGRDGQAEEYFEESAGRGYMA